MSLPKWCASSWIDLRKYINKKRVILVYNSDAFSHSLKLMLNHKQYKALQNNQEYLTMLEPSVINSGSPFMIMIGLDGLVYYAGSPLNSIQVESFNWIDKKMNCSL